MSFSVIVADGDMLCGVDLELLQVISSLTFRRGRKMVSMVFDFLVASHRDVSTKLLLVHRGLAFSIHDVELC